LTSEVIVTYRDDFSVILYRQIVVRATKRNRKFPLGLDKTILKT